MMRSARPVGLSLLLSVTLVGLADAADLRGSRASMVRQHGVATQEAFTFLRTPAQVQRLADEGALEPVLGNGDYELAGVSYPYARPAVRRFIEDLAAEYRAATGQPLVITSLTRPASRQPGNAHRLSVHPAGMAVDLRVPSRAVHSRWLEERLLGLESEGVLDVTKERSPPHYHVAVFPEAYLARAGKLEAAAVLTAVIEGRSARKGLESVASPTPAEMAPSQVTEEEPTPGSRVPLPLLLSAALLPLVCAGVGGAVRRP